MRYDEVLAALSRANPDEWALLPELVTEDYVETILALREDLAVTLALFDDPSVPDFGESWVPPYHEVQPKMQLELRYHGLVVERQYLVYLDGLRWLCPLPRPVEKNQWVLSAASDRLGAMLNRIINPTDTLGWEGRKAQVIRLVEEDEGSFEVE